MRCIVVLLIIACVIFSVLAVGPIECNRKHEEYQCGSACQTKCATLGETCPIVNIRCNDACYCVKGYARDSRGVCIPIERCPPKHG